MSFLNQFSTQGAQPNQLAGADWFSREGMFGEAGWATPVMQGAGVLTQGILGFQGLGMAQDQLDFQKNAWAEQFAIQKEEYDYQKAARESRAANYDAYRSQPKNI